MSYTPNTWSSNDLVTAAKMNHIEEGIVHVSAKVTTVEVATSDWTNKTYTLSLANISDATWVEVHLGQTAGYLTSYLDWVVNDDNTITFSVADTIPSGTLSISIVAWGMD